MLFPSFFAVFPWFLVFGKSKLRIQRKRISRVNSIFNKGFYFYFVLKNNSFVFAQQTYLWADFQEIAFCKVEGNILLMKGYTLGHSLSTFSPFHSTNRKKGFKNNFIFWQFDNISWQCLHSQLEFELFLTKHDWLKIVWGSRKEQ